MKQSILDIKIFTGSNCGLVYPVQPESSADEQLVEVVPTDCAGGGQGQQIRATFSNFYTLIALITPPPPTSLRQPPVPRRAPPARQKPPSPARSPHAKPGPWGHGGGRGGRRGGRGGGAEPRRSRPGRCCGRRGAAMSPAPCPAGWTAPWQRCC